MLILARKAGQSIQIGDDITVTLTEIKGSIVRLGIDAPQDVPIVRGELKRGEKHEEDDYGPT